MKLKTNPIPHYKIGDRWFIESHFIEDMAQMPDVGEELKDIVFCHKYEVVSEQSIGDNKVWVIDIKAVHVPKDFPDDHGDNFLWQLYINQENFTLMKIKSSIRSRLFLVSGSEVESQTIDFINKEPAVLNSIILRTPIDIPKFPIGEFPRFLEYNEIVFSFLNEDTSTKCYQRMEIVEQMTDQTNLEMLYITLYGPAIGYRTQVWVAGLPWWKEWRKVSNDGDHRGLWYAKLIEET